MEDGNYKELFGKSDGLLGIEDLGIHMLKCLFDLHDMARNEVGKNVLQFNYISNF